MPVLVLTATIFKFKMAVRYHVGSDWMQASYEPTYRLVCFCQFVYFLHQYYFELWQFSDFHSGHSIKFKMAARYHVDSKIGTNFI